nr:unnamed protein product [Digitaria exilis]
MPSAFAYISGTYIDKKCPVTSTVSIRGRAIVLKCTGLSLFVGTIFTLSRNTKGKYEKRRCNIPAHISPCFRVKERDHVIIGQGRPLSKTVRFNVLKVIPAGSKSGAVKKSFTSA